MENILTVINNLSREQAIEAASIVANNIPATPTVTEQEYRNEFGDPSTHVDNIEELSRIILINAADNPEYSELVEAAISDTGKRQFVLGGSELIALGIIAVAVIRILRNPPTKKRIKIKKRNGDLVEIENEYNNDTGFLSDIFGKSGKN